MKDRWYWGWDETKQQWVLFAWDLPHEPSSENEAGYDDYEGPFEIEEEAREFGEERGY